MALVCGNCGGDLAVLGMVEDWGDVETRGPGAGNTVQCESCGMYAAIATADAV